MKNAAVITLKEEETIKSARFQEDYKQSLLVDEEILMSRGGSRVFGLEPIVEDITEELFELEDDTETEDEAEFMGDPDWVLNMRHWMVQEIRMRYGIHGVPRFVGQLRDEEKEVFDDMVVEAGGLAAFLIRYVGYDAQHVLEVVEE